MPACFSREIFAERVMLPRRRAAAQVACTREITAPSRRALGELRRAKGEKITSAPIRHSLFATATLQRLQREN
jgi:hypothetical protein